MNDIWIRLNSESLARWITSDIVSYDIDDGVSEPTTHGEAIAYIQSLIENYADDQGYDGSDMARSMVTLLTEGGRAADADVLIPLGVDALAGWLTNDIVSHDNDEMPEGGWTIEPTTRDEAISHIKTLIEDYAGDQRFASDDLVDRLVALLTEVAK